MKGSLHLCNKSSQHNHYISHYIAVRNFIPISMYAVLKSLIVSYISYSY